MQAEHKMARKVKKLNRRGTLTIHSLSEGLDEKKEIIAALIVKCDKTEEEVLKAYEEFHLKYENGFISREEFTNSTKVNIN